jgi:hypothetical protein
LLVASGVGRCVVVVVVVVVHSTSQERSLLNQGASLIMLRTGPVDTVNEHIFIDYVYICIYVYGICAMIPSHGCGRGGKSSGEWEKMRLIRSISAGLSTDSFSSVTVTTGNGAADKCSTTIEQLADNFMLV